MRIDVICRGVHPALKAHLSRPLIHFSGIFGRRPSAWPERENHLEIRTYLGVRPEKIAQSRVTGAIWNKALATSTSLLERPENFQ